VSCRIKSSSPKWAFSSIFLNNPEQTKNPESRVLSGFFMMETKGFEDGQVPSSLSKTLILRGFQQSLVDYFFFLVALG
jgi:hypothetical protein